MTTTSKTLSVLELVSMSSSSNSKSPSLQLDTKNLDLLDIVAGALKEWKDRGNGSISGSDLLSVLIDKLIRFECFAQPRKMYFSPPEKSIVESMKTIIKFLVSMLETLADTVMAADTISLKPRSPPVDLNALPDDVLAEIIELAALEGKPNFRALRLSQVSRRFRAISLHLPKIWSRVSYDYHGLEMTRLYATRSNHTGLEVTMEDCEHYIESRRMLQAAVPFCHEWLSFSYTVFHEASHFCCVKEHQTPMKLPRLVRLESVNDYEEVYKMYEMPNLKSAHFTNSIPSPSFLSTISTFSMTFNHHDEDDFVDLGELWDFLVATPTIRDLSLAFKSPLEAFGEGMPYSKLSLPGIETFTLNVVFSDYTFDPDSWDDYRDFVYHLVMPNVSHVNLSVIFNSRGKCTPEKDDFVFNLLPRSELHPKLTSLSLTVVDGRAMFEKSTNAEEYDDILAFPAEFAPFLTSIKLRTNYEFYLYLEDDTPFFPLRRLELDYCPRITDEFLADVYRGLNRDGNWESFEEAIVRGCPLINTNTGFMNSITKEKIRAVPVSRNETGPFRFNDW
ncbi:hypothetical protein SCHPADRAFT_995279 [Schizopora paradoxa]|uniref:F-box domain-containing protein n=1 Tax=Schizopora paradoxa TaxID=27342 RepID=A0A0H2RVU4_9AGAM|nr:hypothetical protein SCHPADRAFT_995279 [Schizopora paradoxa]